ncbi:MAG: hypothetical protein ACLP50_09000 [Solirubrobacteraceae bacterium]
MRSASRAELAAELLQRAVGAARWRGGLALACARCRIDRADLRDNVLTLVADNRRLGGDG